MLKFKVKDILDVTNGILISGDINTDILNISTDSRKIKDGDLFIPIVGEKFDGHEFIHNSYNLGAVASLTQRSEVSNGNNVLIKVDDTLKALRDIAIWYRSKFNIPFIAVTGSVGKTSTKDMVATVLSQERNTLKTQGNFNNEIGLPLTIFRLDSSHEAAVIEMGMSGFGEISRLTSIVQPNIALITNIGLSHIEKLGSRQNILKAKMEIIEGLQKDGTLVLNGDDHLLFGMKDLLEFKTVFYGMEEGMDYQAYNIKSMGENGTYFEITIRNEEYKIHIPVPGIHNVYNSLAAIAVGNELKISMEQIIKGISQFTADKMRLNVMSAKGLKIINDTYNASPSSMKAAIDVLKEIGAGKRKIAVLGDMLEMGEWAGKAHIEIGEYLIAQNIDYIFTVGEHGRNIAKGAQNSTTNINSILAFDNNDEVITVLKDFIKENDIILVKGSRGMKMEEIVNQLTVDS